MDSTHCNFTELREIFELFFFFSLCISFYPVKKQQLVVNHKREDRQSYVLER